MTILATVAAILVSGGEPHWQIAGGSKSFCPSNVGLDAKSQYVPLFVAVNEGFFTKHGIDLEISEST